MSEDDDAQTKCCDTCRFWDNSTQLGSAEPDTTGQCRIRPPKVSKITGRAVWPFTEDSDWCGEYDRNPYWNDES